MKRQPTFIKVHKFKRNKEQHQSQTDYEYNHTTVCGYVKDLVTNTDEMVTCKCCLKVMKCQEIVKH